MSPDPLDPRGPSDDPEPSGEQPVAPGAVSLPPRRLHGAGITLAALDNIRSALITIIALVVLGSRSSDLGPGATVVLALLGAAGAVLTGYVGWRAERYAIVDGALRHRRGVISPDETVIPLTRVHAIDTAEGPIQRLFGVHELHVQTEGGGADGEIVLRAVSEEAARELRTAAGLREPVAADLPEWRLSGRGLLATAMTMPQLGLLVPVVGVVAAMFDDLLRLGIEDTLRDSVSPTPGEILVLVLVVGVGAWLLSLIGAVVTFGGFTVTRDGDRLRIRRGLLQRRAMSISMGRVHAITIVEGPLRRPFGLCNVRLETIGYGSEPTAARTLFPLMRLDRANQWLGELVPPFADAVEVLEGPPARARRRYVMPEAVLGATLGIALTLVWSWAWPAIPLLLLLGGVDGALRHRTAGWRLADGLIALRRGSIRRRTLVARADRLQSRSVSRSPLQRRAGLADIAVTVASGARGAVSHLDRGTAGGILSGTGPIRPAAGRGVPSE